MVDGDGGQGGGSGGGEGGDGGGGGEGNGGAGRGRTFGKQFSFIIFVLSGTRENSSPRKKKTLYDL